MSRYRMEAENKGKSDEQILKEHVAALERSLQMERMRCRALEKVIEIAEREEGISIFKKMVSSSKVFSRCRLDIIMTSP